MCMLESMTATAPAPAPAPAAAASATKTEFLECASGYSVKGQCVPVGISPLSFYLSLPDSHYSYFVAQTFPVAGLPAMAYVLNMTSQQWLTDDDFNSSSPSKSIWTHQLVVVIPTDLEVGLGSVDADTAFLWIAGGQNSYPVSPISPDNDEVHFAALVAIAGNSPAAVLKQVPNQPVSFAVDIDHEPAMYPDGLRSEDGIIAYTWNHFAIGEQNKTTRNAEWLLRLPMTKSVARAMDTVTDFVLGKIKLNVTGFVVGGESKRGWTTWTTGVSLASRCRAIIPVVMDLLNFIVSTPHTYQSLGGWTFEFNDYIQAGVISEEVVNSQAYKALIDVIDAYAYFKPGSVWGEVSVDFTRMPKFVINAGNDEFFLPTDNHDWWQDLPGEKHLLHIPNADHGFNWQPPALGTQVLVDAVVSFFASIASSRSRQNESMARPSFEWRISDDGAEIYATKFSLTPTKVTQWTATTNDGYRDFRFLSCRTSKWRNCTMPEADPVVPPLPGGPEFRIVEYKATPAEQTKDGWRASVPIPTDGNYSAFVLSAYFDGGFHFTTQMSVVPVGRPFSPCHGADCLFLV